MNRQTALDRRTVLRGLALTGAAGLAGCMAAGFGSDDTALDPPENYDKLREADLPYPIHGEKLPDVAVPDPIEGTDVSTREFVGQCHVLVTFVYTRCGSICPALTSNLVQVQADATERGYGDQVALLAVTFDPEYDTAERLAEFGRDRGADVTADNWHFLRPESEERVDEVVVEAFGHPFQENPGKGMPFLHNPLLVLANDEGYVERSYSGEVPNPQTVIDDVRTLVG